MKKLTTIIAALAAVISFASCDNDDDVLAYSQTEICNIENGRLRSDNGYYFNVVKNQTSVSNPFEGMDRAVIYCDVLNLTEGTTDEYDINLIQVAGVTLSSFKWKSTSSEDVLGSDAAAIQSAWFSGDYLNLDATYVAYTSTSTKHDISLVIDDVKSNTDTLYLTLRHNAHGETYENTTSTSGISLIGEYYSYPVSQLIPRNVDSIVVSFTWDWFVTDNGYLTKDREISTGCLTWKKDTDDEDD